MLAWARARMDGSISQASALPRPASVFRNVGAILFRVQDTA